MPQPLPYLPPSQPPKPMVVESRMPSEAGRYGSKAAEMRRLEKRNIVRTWCILGGGIVFGVILILVKL